MSIGLLQRNPIEIDSSVLDWYGVKDLQEVSKENIHVFKIGAYMLVNTPKNLVNECMHEHKTSVERK